MSPARRRNATTPAPGAPGPGVLVSGTGAPSASGSSKPCRCVLLVGRGAPGSQRLVEGLEKRGAAVEVVPDPPSAMVEMAQGASILIVHEPGRVRRLPELLAAVRRYYPKATCWQYGSLDGNGHGRLALLREHEPSPRAGVEPGPQVAPADAALPDDPAPPLISSEELSMLLGSLSDETNVPPTREAGE